MFNYAIHNCATYLSIINHKLVISFAEKDENRNNDKKYSVTKLFKVNT